MEENILYKETLIEENLINLLWELGIYSSVKTNKKSLPYKETFEITLLRNKPFSNSFNFKKVYREFIKEVLNKGYRKIRFYCELIPSPQNKNHSFSSINKPNYICYIRYYIHY
jgi:hypothetical protein